MQPTSHLDITVTIYVEKDGDGFYAYAPALEGLHVGGDTEEEALINAKDGVFLYLESLIEHGEPFPEGEYLKIEKTTKSQPEPLSVQCQFPAMLGDKLKISQPRILCAH